MQPPKSSLVPKGARTALQASAQGVFIDSMAEGIAVLHADKGVFRVNPAFCQLFRLSQDELAGADLDDLIVPEDKLAESRDFDQALLAGQHGSITTQRRRHDGTLIEVAITGAPITQGEEVIGTILMFRDVTDQRTFNDQALESQKMEAIGRLVGNISHDFNNLLTAIMVYCGLLQENLSPAHPARLQAEEIYAAAEQGSELVRQLLSIARQRRLEPTLVSMTEVVNDLADMLQRLIGEQITMKISAGSGVGLIEVDRTQVQQAILNIALNARDVMPQGGALTITTRSENVGPGRPIPEGKYVLVSIIDTGSGMDEATRGHIFEPFFSTKPAGKGTGLGLTSVHAVVTQAGGYIQVTSHPGRGTRFDLYFPEASSTPIKHDKSPVPSEHLPRRGSETILVVEDQDRVRMGISKALAHSGYSVLSARDAEEALQLSREHHNRIHLLITDVVMPGLAGDQLANLLIKVRPDLKIMFMSGYNTRSTRLLNRPGASFAEKPVRFPHLLRTVRELLDGAT
jgi:two-component system cell cycle sensor histidine kinase/response regulator CckA